MIICANCGTTNPSDERTCRTCGALLPISDKSPRIKIGTSKEKIKSFKSKTEQIKEKKIKKPLPSELQEIPKENDNSVLETNNQIEEKERFYELTDNDNEFIEETKEILKEITPKPFKGSILSSKEIYRRPFIENTKSSIVKPSERIESILLKQKQLEEDMTKVLKFLSKKITFEKLPSEKEKEERRKKEKLISPSSMNEILKELLKLDLHIEASAIIKKDGTILASAISSRISDSLFATIGQSLSLIGRDIIESLNAGELINISLRGSHGVLDLASIDLKASLGNDMILVILSNPRVKSGIIHFAANIVKKQVKEYLGISR